MGSDHKNELGNT